MKTGSSALRSAPFITLYLAAGAAVILNLKRQSWGSAGWYPIAVGLVAAGAIIPLRHLFKQFMLARPGRNRRRVVFFAIIAVFTGIGAAVLVSIDALLALGLLGTSALFTWACLATAFQWPGFRDSPKANECRHCRYDLTGNQSGICPECGQIIDRE